MGLKEQGIGKGHLGKGRELGDRQKKELGTWEQFLLLTLLTIRLAFVCTMLKLTDGTLWAYYCTGPEYSTTKLSISTVVYH